MKEEIAKQWEEALLSGKYSQGQGTLKQIEGGKFLHCCLGVLCEIAAEAGVISPSKPSNYRTHVHGFFTLGSDSNPALAFLPSEVMKWAEIQDPAVVVPIGPGEVATLSSLNDSMGYNFELIASIINKHWKAL